MLRHHSKAGVLFLVLALLALSPSLAAQTSNFVITGTVRLPDGTPAARSTVRITSQLGLDRQTFADDMGNYEFRDLPVGRYHLTATTPEDPTLYADPVPVEVTRLFGNRFLAHINLRRRVDIVETESRSSTISVAEAVQNIPKAAQRAFEDGLRQRSDPQQLSRANASFSRAIELFPSYFQAYAERGHLWIGTGKIREAAQDFRRALALNERYEPALRGAGICHVQEGRYAEAIADLERATSLEANNATSFLFLGVANAMLDRREAARKALERALALDAVVAARARVHIANIELKEGRLKEAAAQLDAYLSAVPNAPDAERLRSVRAEIEARLSHP